MSTPRGSATKVSPDLVDHPWLLGAITADTRRALLAAGIERHYAAEEVLYLAGTPASNIHLVLEGRVRLMRDSARAIMIHDERAGGCLGEVPLFEGTTYPATAIASERTRCLVISRVAVLAAVRENPDLALALLSRLAARVRAIVQRLDDTGKSTQARLAEHLLACATASRSASFTLGGTQQQVAEEMGTVRELVVRGLKSLQDRGAIIRKGNGRLVIADEQLLRAVAADRV